MDGRTFEVGTRIVLDNSLASVKVARRHEECNSIVEIVPNPFGGVNTHLWSNDAYLVGIVPIVRHAYSLENRKVINKEWKGTNREEACLSDSLFRDRRRRVTQQKNLNHHEAEDEDFFHTEEAQCGTDRMGVADDR